MGAPREPGIWFPAKRYGWGWGVPCAWQGWVFLVGWVLLLLAGVLSLGPEHPVLHGLFGLVMVAVLLAVCYAKGESPRWRWGGDPK